MNSVRLYSNGTAVISREYRFDGAEPLRIAIPVRKSDLDDVISSIAVFGDVTVVEPPTYSPTNAEQATLTLDHSGALRSLAVKLAGASVEVEAGVTYRGRLVGLQPFRREFERTFLETYRIVILTEKGVQQVDDSSVTALRFTEAAVQAEVDKSLRSSLSKIKPDSSQVELTVRPNPGSDGATVTYATPVAAWKIRYQLRLASEDTELDGQAVVDNDTDDDWAETLITVITGEPITFSTDLAETRRPERSRVNVVADRAAGAVIAEPVLPPAAAPVNYPSATRGHAIGAAQPGSAKMLRAEYAFPPDALEDAGPAALMRAVQVEAEARESGDFSVFTSPDPVNVGAGRSAIIPLFRAAVGESRTVLLYREKDDPRRPFRAVRLRNPSGHALGRGVCEVFLDGDFQGKCLLESTKPGEEALLVYAKETGVRVFKVSPRSQTRRMAIRISQGVGIEEVLHRQRTTYRISNGRDEAFPLEIEHARTLRDSTFRVGVSSGVHEEAEIPSGRRIRVDLPAKGNLEVKVVEEQVERKRVSLSIAWLAGNLIGLDAPGAADEAVRECIDLQARVDAIEAEAREQTEKSAALIEEQERLMKLIPKGHAEQANAWRSDLAEAERELRQIKRVVLPELRSRLEEAKRARNEALNRLQYDWAGPPGGKVPRDRPAGSES